MPDATPPLAVQPPTDPNQQTEGDTLDGVDSGSLFETETKTEADTKQPYKLEYGTYAKQALAILVVISFVVILAIVLFYRPAIEGFGSLLAVII